MIWKSIQISPSAAEHLTPLLISTAFKKDGYTVHLTDLTYIWSESLDRRAIIRRSREEATSIDPSDGDQFQIFLDKIKLGLGGARNTTLALTINADAADRPSLVLNVSVNLSGGLAPFVWPIQLAASPQQQLTSQLTAPLLRAQHAHMQEIASLAEVLKEKDHVIQKLLDKLESQGTEWGHIFLQAAGRKVDRKKAEERVRGLGVFDIEGWRKGLDLEVPQDTAQVIRSIFTGDNVEALPTGAEKNISEEQDRWWQSIKGITVNLSTGKISTNVLGMDRRPTSPTRLTAISTVRAEESTDDDGDAFQTQESPPRSVASIPPPAKDADDTTDDDDDDLDGPSQRKKSLETSLPPSPPVASLPKVTKKLGKIGGNKTTPKSPPPVEEGDSTEDDDDKPFQAPSRSSNQTTRKYAPPVAADDESTGDEFSPGKKISSKKDTSPIPEKAPSRSIKKLGKIGGKKEALIPPQEPEPEREPKPPPAKTSETPKPKAKLGKIGARKRVAEPEVTTVVPQEQIHEPAASSSTPIKKKLGTIGYAHRPAAEEKAESSATAEDERQERGRTSAKKIKEKTPEPRETSTERADRRRLELKRALEERANAPKKKKKKF